MNEHNYCVILAGGKGRRLWPASRVDKPKQFIDFFGTGQTQLQQTYNRILELLPADHIFISTNSQFIDLVHEQLPEVSDNNILPEPIYRNTAPSVAWAMLRILKRDKQARMLVTPSDQAVFDKEKFKNTLEKGFDFVGENDCLLTLGVLPTRPEPSYGYIQIGETTDKDKLFKVKTFTEKPDRTLAQMFMDSGEFLWNTGLFMSNICYLCQCFDEILPEVLSRFNEDNPDFTIEEEMAFIKDNYSSYPHLSIDYGILERSENVYVMSCDFGWADLGTWHSMFETLSKDDNNNVILSSDVIIDESKNNIIKLSKGKLGVVNGLDGFIVIEQDDVLLICKKEDSSARIKKYIAELELREDNKFI